MSRSGHPDPRRQYRLSSLTFDPVREEFLKKTRNIMLRQVLVQWIARAWYVTTRMLPSFCIYARRRKP